MLRNIIVSQLTPEYKVIPARDGVEALQLVQEQRPDLIVLDILLPKLGGFGVLETMRSMPDTAMAQTPVLVLSNLADPQNIERAKQYNVLDYFTKSDATLGVIVNRVKRFFAENK